MNRYPLKVTEFAVNKSGFSAEEIQARYQVAYMGYSDYFTYKNCRFFINCNGADNKIDFLSFCPIEEYEEDLRIEKEERERKKQEEAEKQRRIYFAGREGTRTERRRNKRASNLIARGI